MADQEFSSPGAHMASRGSSSSSGLTSSGVIYSPGSSTGYNSVSQLPTSTFGSNIIYAPYGSSSASSGASRRDSSDEWYSRTNYLNNLQRELTSMSQSWSEYMSSTAMQRTIADYKKAGINPILAVMNLGANSWTSVGAPSAQGANVSDISSAYAADVGLQSTRETNFTKEQIAAADRMNNMSIAELNNKFNYAVSVMHENFNTMNNRERIACDEWINEFKENQANFRQYRQITSDETLAELSNAVLRQNNIDSNMTKIYTSYVGLAGDLLKIVPNLLRYIF